MNIQDSEVCEASLEQSPDAEAVYDQQSKNVALRTGFINTAVRITDFSVLPSLLATVWFHGKSSHLVGIFFHHITARHNTCAHLQ